VIRPPLLCLVFEMSLEPHTWPPSPSKTSFIVTLPSIFPCSTRPISSLHFQGIFFHAVKFQARRTVRRFESPLNLLYEGSGVKSSLALAPLSDPLSRNASAFPPPNQRHSNPTTSFLHLVPPIHPLIPRYLATTATHHFSPANHNHNSNPIALSIL